MRKTKWKTLLKDENVKRWFENLKTGSEVTATERIRVLHRFLRAENMTPKSLLKLAKKHRRAAEDMLQDFVVKLRNEGKAPGYIQNYVKAVRSWLTFNDILLLRRIKVGDTGSTPTLEDERVPTREELRTLIGHAKDRAMVSISLMAFSGLRPQVLGTYSGTDGLKIGDLPELKIDEREIVIKRTPMRINVRRSLSKARHKYFTFLSEEGCEYLKAYLELRLARGEKLDRNSPVIAVTPGFELKGKSPRTRGSKFITTPNITREIRETIRPRFNWRPYILRAYFDTQMLLAESNGKMNHAYRQFFMGHKGDIEARYTTHKGRLPETLVEDMRLSYSSAEPFLSTIMKPETNAKEMLLTMWRQQAKMYGIDPMMVRIEKEKTRGEIGADEEIRALQEEIIKRTAPHLAPSGSSYINGQGREHRIITEKELVKHLNDGWELIRELSNGKFLVRSV